MIRPHSEVGLQLLENKALSWGVIRKSACILTEITIRKSQFLVLVGDILHRIADLMHNALLHVCMGKYRMDGIREASQAVNRGDENILDSAVFDFSEHAEPELCTLVFPDPQGDCSI